MRTREESLNNFCKLIDSLTSTKYLLVSSKIFDVVTYINSSKLLSDAFSYFTKDFNFEEVLTSCFCIDGEDKRFILPDKNTDVLALVYLLLKEMNSKRLQLTDLLDFFDGGKDYEISYVNFCKEVLIPFKSYTYQIGMQIINNTQGDESEHSILAQEDEYVNETTPSEAFNVNCSDYATLRRLIDLDRLSIMQSKLHDSDKEELEYVLKLFENELKGLDKDKIKLSYLAYYYCMKPFKKVKNNLKEIAEILISKELL